MRQETLTLVAPLRDAARARKIVEKLADDTSKVAAGSPQPKLFQKLGVHFARIVVIEEASSSPYGASLVLESNFDTDEPHRERARSLHLRALVRARGDELAELWSCCTTELPRGESDLRAAVLARFLVPHTAAYQGHVHRDLARIELEAKVRDAALGCAARLPRGLAPDRVYQAIRQHVKQTFGDLHCDQPAPALPDAAKRRKLLENPKRAWIVEGLPFALAGLLGLPVTLALVGLLLGRERSDRAYDMQTESESMGPELLRRLQDNADSEDYGTQNALTHLVPVRSGIARKLTLRLSHAYLDRVAENHFNFVEQLGGIPSIHFAKWLLIDGGRRLLFFSNYDGSWESYLGDFVDQAAVGLNLAWMATEGYPNTRFVAGGGANDEETFKAWARVHQRPTPLFYSAYPTLSVADVNNNSWLRHGLHLCDAHQLEGWLRRIT